MRLRREQPGSRYVNYMSVRLWRKEEAAAQGNPVTEAPRQHPNSGLAGCGGQLPGPAPQCGHPQPQRPGAGAVFKTWLAHSSPIPKEQTGPPSGLAHHMGRCENAFPAHLSMPQRARPGVFLAPRSQPPSEVLSLPHVPSNRCFSSLARVQLGLRTSGPDASPACQYQAVCRAGAAGQEKLLKMPNPRPQRVVGERLQSKKPSGRVLLWL